MRKKRILKIVLAVASSAFAHVALAQSGLQTATSASAAAAATVIAPVQSYTLGDLADIARDVEFEKQRRALREAKGVETKPVAAYPMPVKKKVKSPPKPITPEGLQVRAIFGVKPNETIRFYTSSGQFEDHQVGDTVQGWAIVGLVNEWVTLQKGTVVYPLALQMRVVVVEPAAGTVEPSPTTRNVVQSGPLPSPKLVSGQ
jgi:hypothetical protein